MYSKNNLTITAGITYILIILLGVFSVNFVEMNLVISGDPTATFINFTKNEYLLRMGVVAQIIMFALVIILSWAFFEMLKEINEGLALLALLFRSAEAIIGVAICVVSGLIPLLLINNSSTIKDNQIHQLFDLLLKVRIVGLDVVLVFVGLGATLFCYLLFKSRFIPRFLSIWGIAVYISMILLGLSGLLFPIISENAKMFFYIPGTLFEITIGLWFLIKGIRTKVVSS